ncbi:uncharacterized protein LOC121697116 isoform X1 [Alosa sapidissima]|uniref:uncharacterized protein LOC121697116 isoform X1 n=1 Tax=Alosa sapidissima TaxID=34773 RepID=UPI001C095A71|nr:uncharacterized protein LOC121697116 isoform X1 [Alosa sapidissima]
MRLRNKHKLADRWESSVYRVIKQVDDVPVYVVQPEGTDGPTRTLHRDLLLPCGVLTDEEPLEQPEKGTTRQPRTRNRPVQLSESDASDSESDNSCTNSPPISPDRKFTGVYKIPKRCHDSSAVLPAGPEMCDGYLPMGSLDDVLPVCAAAAEGPVDAADVESPAADTESSVPAAGAGSSVHAATAKGRVRGADAAGGPVYAAAAGSPVTVAGSPVSAARSPVSAAATGSPVSVAAAEAERAAIGENYFPEPVGDCWRDIANESQDDPLFGNLEKEPSEAPELHEVPDDEVPSEDPPTRRSERSRRAPSRFQYSQLGNPLISFAHTILDGLNRAMVSFNELENHSLLRI